MHESMHVSRTLRHLALSFATKFTVMPINIVYAPASSAN